MTSGTPLQAENAECARLVFHPRLDGNSTQTMRNCRLARLRAGTNFEAMVHLGPNAVSTPSRRHSALLAALLSLGCSSVSAHSKLDGDHSSSPPVTEQASDAGARDESTQTDASDRDTATDGGGTSTLDRCSPGPGASGRPQTVVEVVELINSLPMPVTIPCLLRSLDRPLQIVATYSVISAQPANGQDNPRLFIVNDGMSMSVVPTGEVSHLLELGELASPTRSIKGEIAFPVMEPLALSAPFEHIARPVGGTVCYVCHHDEVAASGYTGLGAFESVAYRPVPRYEINFDYVEYQYTTCDAEAEPERCAFYAALFDQGGVSHGAFPEEMPTFE